MLILVDFSAVLQVVIAFYGVYAVKSKDIGNTLIFHIIRDSITKLHDMSIKHLEDTKEGYEKLQKDLSKIDQKKLSGPQKVLMTTEEKGAKQEVEIAKRLNEKLDIIYRNYIGQSYFPVLAVDNVLLSFIMLVLGALDCKLIWNVDGLCLLNVCFVAILVIHCLIYEFSMWVRGFSKYEPSIICHVTLIGLFLAFSIVLTEYSELLKVTSWDINQYMLIYGAIVLLPPMIIVVRNIHMINGIKKLLGESIANREYAMNWFYRDVLSYKKMYPLDDE